MKVSPCGRCAVASVLPFVACREAYDERKGRKYYYHRVTKDTKWSQPTQHEVVETFLRHHNMDGERDVQAVDRSGHFSAPPTVGFSANFRRAASAKFGQVRTWNEERRNAGSGGNAESAKLKQANKEAQRWHLAADQWKRQIQQRDQMNLIGLLLW